MGGEHIGKINRIVKDGSAFLENQYLATEYGTEAYAHSTVVQQCGLSVGDVIAFSIHVSKSGQPQVSAPCWRCCSDNWQHDGLSVDQPRAPSYVKAEIKPRAIIVKAEAKPRAVIRPQTGMFPTPQAKRARVA